MRLLGGFTWPYNRVSGKVDLRSKFTFPTYRLERSRWGGGGYAWARTKNFPPCRLRLYYGRLMTWNSLFKNAEFSTGFNSFKRYKFGTFLDTFSIDRPPQTPSGFLQVLLSKIRGIDVGPTCAWLAADFR